MIGCCLPDNMEEMQSDLSIKKEHSGGHIIQNNVFRFNSTGIRVIGVNPNTVLIRNNVFQDNYHGLTINGANVTVEENKFYSSTPDKVPVDGEVGNAIGVLPFSSMFRPGNAPELKQDCFNILIKGNTIENISEDIIIHNPDICNKIELINNMIKK